MFSPIGTLHLIVSIIALVASALVLAGKKESVGHKRTGYVYVAAMTVLLVTSFMIYRLHGSFGVLHCSTPWMVVATLTVSGIGAMYYRKYKAGWLLVADRHRVQESAKRTEQA